MRFLRALAIVSAAMVVAASTASAQQASQQPSQRADSATVGASKRLAKGMPRKKGEVEAKKRALLKGRSAPAAADSGRSNR